jgi:hypothetical protein
MTTINEVSKMNPSSYKVIDFNEQRGKLKSWDDNIQVMIINHTEHIDATREEAYKLGLCSAADGE